MSKANKGRARSKKMSLLTLTFARSSRFIAYRIPRAYSKVSIKEKNLLLLKLEVSSATMSASLLKEQ